MQSLTLGRIRDIDIKVHPTFVLVVALVAWQWGGSAENRLYSLLFGLGLTLLVFGCVVLHELGHSLMAQHYHIRVFDITLFPIGGVARVEQAPSRPRSEILIALAGPAVNLAIAVALMPTIALYSLIKGFDDLGDLLRHLTEASLSPGSMLIYLFFVNITLILFNLLPAFPMDGGRVLRAGLTTVIGRETATRVAVLVGTAVALALILIGVWFREWSLPLIGIFVIAAAHLEGRTVRLESTLMRLRVGQFALWDMGGIAPNYPLTVALRGGPRDLVVADEGRVVGMLWRHQLLRALNGGAGTRTVSEVMDRNVVTADVDDSVYDVQRLMNAHNRWAIPITENGQYRGIFTAERFTHVYRHLAPMSFKGNSRRSLWRTFNRLRHSWGR